MKHRASLAILSLSMILLITAGCAGTPLRPDTSGLEAEIARLRAQVVELQRQRAMDEVEIARLRQQLGDTAGRPAPIRPSAKPTTEPTRQATATPPPARTTTTPAPPLPRTTAPARPAPPPVQEREEPVGTREIEEIEEADIDVPEAPPVQTRPQPQPTRPATPPPPPPAADSGEVLAPASQALYDRGYTLYHQGHFVDAETSFQRFLQGNPGSELADNASYWIGECRYARGDLRGALAAFRETAARFPEGNKLPDALLKTGQCLEALDDVEGARAAYAEVIRRFPGSAAAQVADERRLSLP